MQTSYSELGRFLVTKNPADIGAFKSETLRNIGITGPYMHDGSLATLWDVMDHYNKGGVPNPYLDGGMQRLALSEAEIDDLVAFLFTLTGDRYADFNKAEMERQASLKNNRPQRETEIAEGRKGDLGDIGTNPDLVIPHRSGPTKHNLGKRAKFSDRPCRKTTEMDGERVSRETCWRGRKAMAHKSIETKYYEERASFFEDLTRMGALSRRGFLHIAGVSAGIAAAKGLIVPQSFQLIEIARAAETPRRLSPSPISPIPISIRAM